MRIILLGSTGQVGWELQRALAPLGEVLALDRDLPLGRGADFADPAALAARVRGLAVDTIVNAAAYTAVDQAEREPDVARTINAEAPAALARVASDTGAWLIHYSTDYVFDGSGTAPRDEDAATGPLGVYGATKLAGEQAIRASGCRHLILRTSWVHSARGSNFARTMLRLAAERDSLRVVDDQVGAPTGADLLADLTAHMLRTARAAESVAGTYHACASGETNWRDYARRVISRARDAGLHLRCAPETVEGIATRDYPTPARRPLNSRLDTRRLRDTFGLALPPWQAGVDRMVDEILPALLPPPR